MELDDLKLAWQTLGARWEQQQALQRELLAASRLDGLRHGLRPLFWGQVLQIMVGVLVTLVAVAFWIPRAAVAHFLVWGLSVHALGVLMIATAARNLHLIGAIDYAAPVLEIQRRLAGLRSWRVQVEAPLYAVVWSFAWIPLVLMAMASAGLDPQMLVPQLTGYLLLSGCASLGLIALAVWLIRRMGLRPRLDDSLAGGSVRKAETLLEQIARFQQE
jgi:hypothetical protein